MCFSATASFVASGALVALGGATFAFARKRDKVLVAIPILFGIQQALEGYQWLRLDGGSSSRAAGYGYLFFALVLWPVYVPSFVYFLDKNRKTLLRWFVLAGLAVAAIFLGLLAAHPLHVRITSSCVSYALGLPPFWVVGPPYLLAILGPLFLSSRKIFRWFGAAILGLAVLSWRLYQFNFISVWCFFAAAVSSMFFLYVQNNRRRKNALRTS